MKRTPLAKKSQHPTAKLKDEVQNLVRQIVIARDGGCILRNEKGITPCNGYAKDGHLILQADHLITRGKNVGYADTRLIVCVCKGHHTSKTFTEKERYEALYRKLIGKKRCELWERVKEDRKNYPMGYSDWQITIAGLKQELANLGA